MPRQSVKFPISGCIYTILITAVLVFSGLTLSITSFIEFDNNINYNNNGTTPYEDEVIQINDASDDNIKHLIELDLTFPVESLDFEEFGGYDILKMPSGELLDRPGEPAVPFAITTVVLPAGVAFHELEVFYEVLEENVLDGQYLILPAQAPRPTDEYVPVYTQSAEITEAAAFEYQIEIYSSSTHFPGTVVEPVAKSNIDSVTLGYFNVFPVQYQPLEKRVIVFSHIRVSITVSVPSNDHEESVYSENYIEYFKDDGSLHRILEELVANPEDIPRFYPTPATTTRSYETTASKLKREDVKYVIITNSTNFYSNFLPLAEWKTKKGVPARIVDNGWIKNTYSGNDTQEKIRNFIKDAVTTWGTEWVLLGGDISVIPYRGGYGVVSIYPADPTIPADLYYSDLDGNWDANANGVFGETTDKVNLYPDVYVGRAPVETTAEVDNFVSKTLKYETNVTYGFQLEMLFMAEKLDSSTDGGISKSYIGTNYVPSRFNITKLYETLYNLSKKNALAEMNRGKGIINHAGHCNWYVMSIGSDSLYISDASSLTNKDKQGILYTIGCITTAFENNDCIAEAFVKNTKGGMVAFVGNSRYGWYSPGSPTSGTSNLYDQEFFNLLLQKDIYHIGETFAESKAKFVPWSSSYGTNRWVQYCLNLLGDPELPIWTDLPKNLSVTHPEKIYYGPQTVTVRVNDSSDSPLKDALVCLQGEDVYAYGFTNSEGIIDFIIDPQTRVEINVTATYYNYYPYQGLIKKIIDDTKPPAMTINTGEYGWYNADPGDVIDVDFDSLGETDLSKAEYALSPAGPWFTIFNKPYSKFTQPWSISGIWEDLDEGFNTVCIRCNDSAEINHWVMGNITVKKDTKAPVITVNQNQYGWYSTDPGVVIDVDFSNITSELTLNGSALSHAEYSINSASGPWYTIFSTSISEYTSNWGVKWYKLVDGTNTITIRLYDEAGNEALEIDNVMIKRDTLPPVIVMRKTSYGWYSTDPGPVIDIDFSNGGNGSLLDYAEVRIGEEGTWLPVFDDDVPNFIANWAVPWSDLVEGLNTLYVSCYDKVGFKDVTNDVFTILKDTTAPKIIINKHVYGWYTTDAEMAIDVDFQNQGLDGSLLDLAQYRVHPESPTDPTGPWRTIFSNDINEYTTDWKVSWSDLYEGNNTIEVQVFDKASNKNSTIDTIYILKDVVSPKVTVNTASYGWFNTDPGEIIDVDFSNLGKGSNLSFAEYRINNGNWKKILDIYMIEYTIDWGVDWAKLVEGENIINVRVWDIAGFSDSEEIKIYKDTIVPEVWINKKNYGWYNKDPGTAIDVDFFKSVSGAEGISSDLDYAQYKVGTDGDWTIIFDQNLKSYTLPWSVDWAVLEEGANIVYIKVCDVAGNLLEGKTILVKKDTIVPSIKVNNNIYGWFNSAMGDIIDVDFSKLSDSYDIPPGLTLDDYSNITKAQYMVCGSDEWVDIFSADVGKYDDNWNVSWFLLTEGVNIVHFCVLDAAGNMFYDPELNITVLRDTESPIVTINQKEFGWYNEDPGAVIDVDFIAGDERTNSPLSNAQYRIGAYGVWKDIFTAPEGSVYNFDSDWGIAWNNIFEGSNTIFIRVFDQAGNENRETEYVYFNRDSIGPEPPILYSPLNNAQTIESTPAHFWLEPKDAGAGAIEYYQVQLDTTNKFSNPFLDITTPKLTYSHMTELALGTYYWRVKAVDVVGNTGNWSIIWQFHVVSKDIPDANLPPTAVAGEDLIVFVNERIVFNGSGSSDPENDPLTYVWYIDDDDKPDREGIQVAWSYDLNGTYLVTLEVIDSFGGYDSDTLTVTVLDSVVDSDKDGMSDEWEIYYGLDPYDPSDGSEDMDNDGFLNNMEFVQGSAPQDSLSTPISANDKTPPKITHQKVVESMQFKAITITATVTDDDSGVKEVNLFYKKKSDLTYYSISMGKDNIYSATIPGSMVTLDDLEYYIMATDNAKVANTAYFGANGQTLNRPSQASDINIDVKENIKDEEQSDMMDDFIQTFNFESLETCFIVLILLIVLLASFGVSLASAVRAKQVAKINEQRRTIYSTRGKNMVWEGSELETIGEDEDMNLLEDDSALDEV